MIDNWINEGSGWIIEFIESQCINISTYRPLSGSSDIDHINPSKEHPERIKTADKKTAEKLDYNEIEFPVKEKDFNKIEVKNKICINVFGYENKLFFPIYVLDQKFEDSIDLLLLIDDNKSHYVYIKDVNRFLVSQNKK